MSEGLFHAHDPRKITDPLMTHHTQRRPYVYFEEIANGTIKIGYVGSLRKGLRRRQQYAVQGANLLAVIPGRDIEERELHRAFADDLAAGNEYFRATEPLLMYIEALLECGFAAPTYEQAEYIGIADFSMWKPGSPALERSVELNGQMSLFQRLPVRERIARIAQNFNGLSLTDDWFTPRIWTDLARKVMGNIDLDPASCKQANDECVGAAYWYTKELNGLDRRNKWFGRMWINPPYGTGANSAKSFIQRLHDEVQEGNVEQAITCLNLNTMCNKWFREFLTPIATAVCIAGERIEFIPPSGVTRSMGSATNGTVFTYVGPNRARFLDVYAKHGDVWIPNRKEEMA